MKHRMKRSSIILALLATLGSAGWSTASYACSTEPYIGSLCIMAWPKASSFGNTYAAANGTLMPISNYQALFAILGTTYGGNGTTNFQLPDLRGRMLIGAGQDPQTGIIYNYGQKGGAPTVTLTTSNLPPHTHSLNAGTTKPVVATTTLGNMAASTTLNGVTASAAGSGLTLNASTGGNFGNNPSDATLGTYSSTTKIYSDAAPTVAMKSGSIGGSAPVTFSGNPATTLSGAPSVTISGSTDSTGSGQPVSIMPPYLPMTYYIAVTGIFPSMD